MFGFLKNIIRTPAKGISRRTTKRRPYEPSGNYHDNDLGIISSSSAQLFQLAYMKGDYVEAKRWAEEALKMNPDDTTARMNLKLAEERIK